MVRGQRRSDFKCAPVLRRCRAQECPVATATTPGEDYHRAIRAGLQDPVGHKQRKTASRKHFVGPDACRTSGRTYLDLGKNEVAISLSITNGL
jgi:hypothetical protein